MNCVTCGVEVEQNARFECHVCQGGVCEEHRVWDNACTRFHCSNCLGRNDCMICGSHSVEEERGVRCSAETPLACACRKIVIHEGCQGFNKREVCRDCENLLCPDCTVECAGCNEKICTSCTETCRLCKVRYCANCYDDHDCPEA